MKNPKLVGGIAAALIVAVCWAILGFGLQMAYAFTDPTTVSWFRFTVAFLVILPYVAFKYRPVESPRVNKKTFFQTWQVPPLTIIAAAGLALNYVAYATGVQLTTAAHAQVLSQLGPLFVFLASILIFKEKLRTKQALGVLTALVGFSLFYHEELQQLATSLVTFYHGNLWILGGASGWAFWAICQKQSIMRGHATLNLNMVTYFCCSALLFPIATPSNLAHLTGPQILLMLALAANTVVAYGLIGLAMEWAPTSIIQLIILCNPVITLFLANEKLTIPMLVATALIIVGVGLAIISIPQIRPRKQAVHGRLG